MELSLAMFAHRLQAFSPILQGNAREKSIKYMRIFTPGQKPAVQTMDVGTWSQFFDGSSASIVCKYGNNYLILNTENKELVINKILEVFQFYDCWREQLNQLIKSGCTLTELLDISSEVIENPMLLLDSSDFMIAVSTRYLTVEVDELWFELIERKSSTPEKILAFHDPSNKIFDIKSREPFYIPPGFFPKGTYSINLYNGPVWCGIFVVIEYLYDLSPGMIDDFNVLAAIIEQWIQQNTSADIFSQSQTLFTEIFAGHSESIPILERRLLSFGWQSTDKKLLIAARALSKNFHTDAYLCRIFNGSSQYIYASPYNEQIIVLCNISGISESEVLSLLGQWFKKSRYSAGISFSLTALETIAGSYRQASIALEHGKKLAGQLCSIKSLAVPYIIHTLATAVTREVLHPAIGMLDTYDKAHHTDYLTTLKVYLENERSHIKTASLLKIHRNTLAQRIARLEEDFHLDLEDAAERFYLLISFYTLSVQGLHGRKD